MMDFPTTKVPLMIMITWTTAAWVSQHFQNSYLDDVNFRKEYGACQARLQRAKADGEDIEDGDIFDESKWIWTMGEMAEHNHADQMNSMRKCGEELNPR
jgi:hypothetical protein